MYLCAHEFQVYLTYLTSSLSDIDFQDLLLLGSAQRRRYELPWGKHSERERGVGILGTENDGLFVGGKSVCLDWRDHQTGNLKHTWTKEAGL